MSKYVVGLTGGIACGKTNLSNALRARGAQVIDADEISRALTSEGGAALPAIREAFGSGVFDGESLNRRALAALVFADEKQREKLNAIVHPLVTEEINARMAAVSEPVLLVVPLLYETGMEKRCDEVWCAWVPQKEQIQRLRKRDRITWREALRKIHSQMPLREKRRRADHQIRTDGTKAESAAIALALWENMERKIKGDLAL